MISRDQNVLGFAFGVRACLVCMVAIVVLASCTLGFVCNAAAVPQRDAEQLNDVRFRWSFAVLVETDDAQSIRPVTEKTPLKSGDKIKLMVELQKKCFVYVIHHSAQGELSMLFPYSMKQFTSDYLTLRKYYIPAGDAWFQVDAHVGTETFYLLAASRRLSEVEYLFGQYETAEPAKKQEAAVRMIAEIRSVAKEREELAFRPDQADQADQADPSHYAIRGIERAQSQGPADISDISYEVSARGVYLRTFSFEHR